MPDTKARRISTLTQLVKATDQALEDEGISVEIRTRIMNRLLYGAPDPRGRPV